MKKKCMTPETTRNLTRLLGEMKMLKRSGWIKRNVKNPESDAEHSFSVAFLVLMLCPDNLDMLKCLKMALIHDLPEVFCGDFVPGEIAAAQKAELETNGMVQIVDNLQRPEFLALFDEFEALETPEARFVNALDKLDNVFTAKFYEQQQNINLVAEFGGTAAKHLQKAKPENIEALSEILKTLMFE